MKATNQTSNLRSIKDCYVDIPINLYADLATEFSSSAPKDYRVFIYSLPDITDTKSASYSDTTVIGRSSPIKTYSQSDNRSISIQFHFFATNQTELINNIFNLRAIQSATYPREGDFGAPFIPPPVCRLKCGALLSNSELCVILKNYSVKYPTDVTWAQVGGVDLPGSVDTFGVPGEYYFPIKFDVDTTWDVVYASSVLPGQSRIFELGA